MHLPVTFMNMTLSAGTTALLRRMQAFLGPMTVVVLCVTMVAAMVFLGILLRLTACRKYARGPPPAYTRTFLTGRGYLPLPSIEDGLVKKPFKTLMPALGTPETSTLTDTCSDDGDSHETRERMDDTPDEEWTIHDAVVEFATATGDTLEKRIRDLKARTGISDHVGFGFRALPDDTGLAHATLQVENTFLCSGVYGCTASTKKTFEGARIDPSAVNVVFKACTINALGDYARKFAEKRKDAIALAKACDI
jgi:hypothetical protein